MKLALAQEARKQMKKLTKDYFKAVDLAREFFVEQGSRGGKKSAGQMTPAQRKDRARKAALARYAKKADNQ